MAMPPTRQPGPETPRAAQIPLSPSSSRHLAVKCRAVLRNPSSPVSASGRSPYPAPQPPAHPAHHLQSAQLGTSPLCIKLHRRQSHRGQDSFAWHRPPGASTPGPTSHFPLTLQSHTTGLQTNRGSLSLTPGSTRHPDPPQTWSRLSSSATAPARPASHAPRLPGDAVRAPRRLL